MFFKRHKKLGREVGAAIEKSLSIYFAGSKYFPLHRAFDPPETFYEDSYILGFVVSFGEGMRQYQYGGKNWGVHKRGEYTVELLKAVDGGGNYRLPEYYAINSDSIVNSAEYKRGSNDGVTYFFAIYGYLQADDPDPILVKARDIAPNLQSTFEALKITGQECAENSGLVTAIAELTIGAHIRENYDVLPSE